MGKSWVQHRDVRKNPPATHFPLMNEKAARATRLLGPLLILTGLALNHWALAWLYSEDEYIEKASSLGKILAGQVSLVLLGLLVVLFWKNLHWIPRWFSQGLALALTGTCLLGGFATLRAHGYFDSAEARSQTEQISRMNASETLHLNLGSSRMKLVNKALKNLRIPTAEGRSVFTDTVVVRDLSATLPPYLYKEFDSVDTRIEKWELETCERSVARDELDLLRPFLDRQAYIESGKIYFIGGDFVKEDFSEWEVNAGFKSFGRDFDGNYVKGKGHLKLRWRLADDRNPAIPEEFKDYEAWRICGITFDSFKSYEAPTVFFEEELDQAIVDPEVLAASRRNIAQEQIVEMLQARNAGEDWEPPHEYWGHQASWRNPAVSVVDLDRDGFDDFYAMARYGKNMFFRNQGDGTFEEIAAELGLDIEDHTGVAIFADFDNDGDDDVFLGRTVARSLYMENVEGRFVDRSDQAADIPLPYFAASAAAVDYDRDGLLDLYVGTYAAQLVPKDLRKPETIKEKMVLDEYLEEDHARRLFEREKIGRRHKVRDRVGPPNLLFRNVGGRFELVEDTPLEHYRNTFQATFADYDGDGDQDVYVANDFAPNGMFRNDDGVFVDVTEESNAADIGFGMGISWGDFDRDGDQDAYVSNMFSKAGNRILPMVKAVDETFLRMAGGNSLLELENGRFERVSSLEGPGYHVEYGGWSWGSLFMDFDNDSWLDLYAISGFYSAPKEIRAGHDL